MKNILLINPAVNPASQNKVVNAVITNVLPTSIGSIVGYLNHSGITDIEIVDEQLHRLDDKELEEIVRSLREPRIIGFSVLTISSKRAYDLAAKIKNIDPHSRVVMGGIHPTVLPDEALNTGNVDIVVRGEGEETFKEIATHILSGTDFKNALGISYKAANNVVNNPDRPFITNLDLIPRFPYHLFEKSMNDYTYFAAVFTSRGCPYNCSFCSSRNVSGRRYRYFSIGRVISEIDLLVNKYNQKDIWLVDDNPAVDKKRFIQIADEIVRNGFNKKAEFHSSMRGDNVTDELLEKAKQANFKLIGFGLETTSEVLMKNIRKGETAACILDAINNTHEKGLNAGATLIFGLPGETRKDRRDAIRIINSLPLSTVRFNTLIPYPGTPAFDELNKAGKLYIKENWSNFAVQYMWESDDIPYVPDTSNRYELLFDTMYANLSFYLNPRGLWRMLKSSFAGGNVISLKKGWYFSLKTHFRLLRLFLYLSRRFIIVTFKMAFKIKYVRR